MSTQLPERSARLEALQSLLRNRQVHGQSELQEELRRLGHDVTQSSVSRDLRKLGAARVGGCYVLPKPPQEAPGLVPTTLTPAVMASLRRIEPAGPHMIVVQTAMGAASAIAIHIDRQGWTEVVGTVAGDDTIFVATTGRRTQTQILSRLRAWMSGAPTHV